MNKRAIIIGAGPAGLTAAYELLQRTDIIPILLEKSGDIGGISKTVNYKGNRIDIGGHRFFSKSDRVMQWWLDIMPIEEGANSVNTISYQGQKRKVETSNTGNSSKVMLLRERLSRIYFLRKFFTYPIQLSLDTLNKLGVIRTFQIILSYLYIRVFPKKQEENLEDFFINRFGNKLYLLFFKDYTEKVWGISCTNISAEWGAQRIKGISIGKAISHALRHLIPSKPSNGIMQKDVETSMIEKFLYPKYGPGELWEEVASRIMELGGMIFKNQVVNAINGVDGAVVSVETQDKVYVGDYFFSTMPIKELVAGIYPKPPRDIVEVSEGLQYRDFITVGVLLSSMNPKYATKNGCLPDTWIYIQERDVKVGRLQIFNNWSPFMVNDPKTIWIGMEYFCNEDEEFWQLANDQIKEFAILELQKLDLARLEDVLDSTVLRMEKAYPAYFGSYSRFDEVRNYLDQFENLFLIGRNGMHKYNNSDHSMLTAMVAVDNIIKGEVSKSNIWSVNTEQEYHEEKATKKDEAPLIVNRGSIEKAYSIKDFAFTLTSNKWWLVGSSLLFILEFILFKIRYPFANYMPDSYSYITAAARNMDVNVWPVGYSKFLRFVSVFSHSDTVVTFFQYFFLQFSIGFFIGSLWYFFRPSRGLSILAGIFYLFNPITLYISNYISADTLFISFSLCWISTLIWIIYRPEIWQIYVQALLLFICFTLRYNALFYPLIAIVAYLISNHKASNKIIGILAGIGLITVSIISTTLAIKGETGNKQFSPFGGWQLANNALYMYQNVPKRERLSAPGKFRGIDNEVRTFLDTLNKVKFTEADTTYVYFYLWNDNGPLRKYAEDKYKKDTITSSFVRWASLAPLYLDYGKYLIYHHPVAFLRSFIYPNAIKYFIPPSEFLSAYNMGSNIVGLPAVLWFKYKSQVLTFKGKDSSIKFMDWYSVGIAIVNSAYLLAILGLLFYKCSSKIRRMTIMSGSFFILNFIFSVGAAPINLRYQIFSMIIYFCLSILLLDYLYKRMGEVEQASIR